MSLQWEEIDWQEEDKFRTERAAVFGGWLVRAIEYHQDGFAYHPSLSFVPDPKHQWEIKHDMPFVEDDDV